MKLDRSRLQEIAGIEHDNLEEIRAYTMMELEHDARELLAKIGLKNPTTTQLQSVVDTLVSMIKTHNTGTVLSV